MLPCAEHHAAVLLVIRIERLPGRIDQDSARTAEILGGHGRRAGLTRCRRALVAAATPTTGEHDYGRGDSGTGDEQSFHRTTSLG